MLLSVYLLMLIWRYPFKMTLHRSLHFVNVSLCGSSERFSNTLTVDVRVQVQTVMRNTSKHIKTDAIINPFNVAQHHLLSCNS